jgi:hypothetical protein
MGGLMEPKFEHDCEGCDFLGHALDADLYICGIDKRDRFSGSVIARYSSDGPDYSSMPTSAVEDMLKRGFSIGDHTQDPPITTHVPFKSTALLILAMALARDKGMTRWEAAA